MPILIIIIFISILLIANHNIKTYHHIKSIWALFFITFIILLIYAIIFNCGKFGSNYSYYCDNFDNIAIYFLISLLGFIVINIALAIFPLFSKNTRLIKSKTTKKLFANFLKSIAIILTFWAVFLLVIY